MLLPDDSDVPPAVSCARCGKFECPGCSPAADADTGAALPWEIQSGSLRKRLWQTAIASSMKPAQVFGELPEGRVGPALAFAMISEFVAVSSIGLLGALALWGIMPDIWARVLTSTSALAVIGALVLGASVIMVALHALWGFCLELGADRRHGARFVQGLRFGLYACGWDLLTSPAGVIQGLLARGPVGAWRPIAAAVRVPRVALAAYLEQHRHFDLAARRRSLRLSVIVLGTTLLGAAAAATIVTVSLFVG
jgi:hypothetical protein